MSTPIARWIPLTAGVTLLVFGTIGGLFSIAIFSHPTLRKCSYARYMLIAAFFDLMTLDHPFVLRILSDGLAIDWISMNDTYCKWRFFTGQTNTFVPITMICLAAIDRWATTSRSVRLRQWSSVRTAHYSIVIVVIFWACTSIPNFFVYRVVDGVCRQTSSIYNTYLVSFLNPVLYCVLPVGILGFFGYRAYNNIRRVTHRQGQSRKKIDEQLTRALILQCCSFTVSQVPYAIWNLYATLANYDNKPAYRIEIEAVCLQISRLCFYFNYSTTFYINLIASKHVRNLVKSFFKWRPCRRQQVDPARDVFDMALPNGTQGLTTRNT